MASENDEKLPGLSVVEFLGRKGNFRFRAEPWEGNIISLRFRDEVFNNSGWVRFNAQTGDCKVQPDKPYEAELSDPRAKQGFFMGALTGHLNRFCFGWSPEPEEIQSYGLHYHEQQQYTQGNANEAVIKGVQAQIIRRLADPKKLLIAGCSNGELVRQCKKIGIETWGFDVILDIDSVAFPQAKGFLRTGSVTGVPFHGSDGFDTLAAIDVLEHIPERDVDAMIAEWVRLGIRKLVLLINLNECTFPGHITLRPLQWWLARWENHFRHVKTVKSFHDLPAVYGNDGLYNHQWVYCERIE